MKCRVRQDELDRSIIHILHRRSNCCLEQEGTRRKKPGAEEGTDLIASGIFFLFCCLFRPPLRTRITISQETRSSNIGKIKPQKEQQNEREKIIKETHGRVDNREGACSHSQGETIDKQTILTCYQWNSLDTDKQLDRKDSLSRTRALTRHPTFRFVCPFFFLLFAWLFVDIFCFVFAACFC